MQQSYLRDPLPFLVLLLVLQLHVLDGGLELVHGVGLRVGLGREALQVLQGGDDLLHEGAHVIRAVAVDDVLEFLACAGKQQGGSSVGKQFVMQDVSKQRDKSNIWRLSTRVAAAIR